MKKSLFFTLLLSIIFIFSSCVLLNDSNTNTGTNIDWTEDEYQNVKLIYTAYNEGWGDYPFSELETRAENNNGAEKVIYFYSYFKDEINLNELINKLSTVKNWGEKLSDKDYRIRNYIGSIIKNSSYENYNESGYDDNWLINYFDSKIPTNSPLIESLNPNINNYAPSNSEVIFLKNKIKDLIQYYLNDGNMFDLWYDFYANSYNDSNSGIIYDEIFDKNNEVLTEKVITEYSEYLTRIALTYINHVDSFNSLFTVNGEPWKYGDSINFKNIPVELLLAVLFQESNFVPFSYRSEVSDNNIHGVSYSLSHILIDSDRLSISSVHDDIGDYDGIEADKIGDKTFSIMSWIYFGNEEKEGENTTNVFMNWDLVSIRGSILYSLTYLDVLMNKLEALK